MAIVPATAPFVAAWLLVARLCFRTLIASRLGFIPRPLLRLRVRITAFVRLVGRRIIVLPLLLPVVGLVAGWLIIWLIAPIVRLVARRLIIRLLRLPLIWLRLIPLPVFIRRRMKLVGVALLA